MSEIISTNQVRQILFNELGLSRDYIRQLVRDEVVATCEKYFRSGQYDKLVRDQIDIQLRTYQYGSDELRSKIANAIGVAIQQQITSKLKISALVNVEAKVQP